MKVQPEVVDLFCGVGALSHGLRNAGLRIVAGYDIDGRCKYAFEKNNGGTFYTKSVAKLGATEVRSHFSEGRPSVLAGCAPCQPFSSYKQRYEEDPQWSLVSKFADLAAEVQADYVTMENVPSLLRYKDGKVFSQFEATLKSAGYKVRHTIAHCEEFGVPQRRRRLVVLASRKRPLPPLTGDPGARASVRHTIERLPALAAGERDADDPLHVASGLSDLNLRRIRASRPGGTWRDWPKELRADCHVRSTGQTYPGVYARMEWDRPAPTMTTQCFGYGNGRFGHPEQDRAITLREAALLQSFPPGYDFLPPEEPVLMKEVGRWIGNAVPVKLAEAIGELIMADASSRGE
jgi:DNA (cytosine-5)-methyltransferase 1